MGDSSPSDNKMANDTLNEAFDCFERHEFPIYDEGCYFKYLHRHNKDENKTSFDTRCIGAPYHLNHSGTYWHSEDFYNF